MSADFIAGFAAGAAQIASSYPFDSIKTRLQAERSNNKLRAGIVDTFAKTVRYEGISGLYKGMMSPLLGIAGLNSILFAANGFAKSRMADNDDHLSLAQIGAAGAFAGVAQALPACTVELVKTKLQIQYVHGGDAGANNKKGQHLRGPADAVRQIVRVEGVRGLFKGATATVAREALGFSAWFVAYEFLNRSARSVMQVDQLNPWMTMLCGGASGVTYWTACMAPDTVKTLMQGQPLGQPKYSSTLDCVQQLYKSEGLAGFYRGFTPAIVRAIPAASSTFLVYTLVKEAL